MNYLGRLGFEEQARSEVGPRSIEILERELHLDSSAKESLPVSWKRWRGRNVELEPSVAVAPKARELSGLTRPRLRQVEETLPKVVGNCPKCQKKTEMKDAKVTKFKNGANGYMSICSVYSRRMVKLGGYVGLGAVV